MFSLSAQAEEKDFEISSSVSTSYNYIGITNGITVSEGIHLQGVATAEHKSGVFVQAWASTDALLGGKDPDDSFEGEIDSTAGYRGTAFSNEVSYQVDYSVFWIRADGEVHDVHNVNGFLNWDRKGDLDFYAGFQRFFTGDFGPGKGLAYKAGAKYKGFNAEAGGHNGLFGTEAETVSFVRFGWSKQIGKVKLSAFAQKGLADPIEDVVSVTATFSF